MLKRHLLPFAAIVFLGASLATPTAEVIEQVLVKVNGEIIAKTEFEQRQVSVLRQRPEFASTTISNEQLRDAIAEITPELILSSVDELLLVQRGKELGYTLGDEQFKSILANIKKENRLDSDEDFQAALTQEGLTMADLRRQLERQMLVSRIEQIEVADKISVADEEARAYYDQRRGEFTTASEVTLREILIDVPTTPAGINVAQDEAAKAEAEAIRARLLAGEPFARLAGDVSAAPSKANGGLIGPLSINDLAPALRTVIDPLQPGDLGEVMRVARGYQILKLESRTEAVIRSFQEARADISDRVAREKHRVARQKYLDNLRQQAIITWRNDELKKAYDQSLAARRAAGAGLQASAPPR